MTNRMKGFTLIELLVVISIIAILAAIIMPVYSRIKESGRQTQCIANLHFLGQAMEIYLSDQKGYPPFDYTKIGDPNQGLMALVNLEYLERVQGSPKALICPDNSTEADSYDVFEGKVVYNWAGYGANRGDWTGYSDPANSVADLSDGKHRYLANRNCPGDTIVTHCCYHRQFSGSNRGAWIDILVYKNGVAEKTNSTQMFPKL